MLRTGPPHRFDRRLRKNLKGCSAAPWRKPFLLQILDCGVQERQQAAQVFAEIQQLFGDVFICGGYFFGHLDGLELNLEDDALGAVALLRQCPQVEALIIRLRKVLHELWLGNIRLGVARKVCLSPRETFAVVSLSLDCGGFLPLGVKGPKRLFRCRKSTGIVLR